MEEVQAHRTRVVDLNGVDEDRVQAARVAFELAHSGIPSEAQSLDRAIRAALAVHAAPVENGGEAKAIGQLIDDWERAAKDSKKIRMVKAEQMKWPPPSTVLEDWQIEQAARLRLALAKAMPGANSAHKPDSVPVARDEVTVNREDLELAIAPFDYGPSAEAQARNDAQRAARERLWAALSEGEESK